MKKLYILAALLFLVSGCDFVGTEKEVNEEEPMIKKNEYCSPNLYCPPVDSIPSIKY